MAPQADTNGTFQREDHQAAYLFDPDEEDVVQRRPQKRRRTSKKQSKAEAEPQKGGSSCFVPLLNGKESPEWVQQREQLFHSAWEKVDGRIQSILRESNSTTLEQVSSFISETKSAPEDQIPSAFIITGPNIASQDLLFEQLSEALQNASSSRFIRLRSSEGLTLKAILKRIIRAVTASVSTDRVDELQVNGTQEQRRYLDYDLEALNSYLKAHPMEHVFVAFQDSEGFDSSLISDLVTLFNSWRSEIPFTLMFGIATSIDLLQARLLKSACRMLYGAQFDAVQSDATLETIFESAVAAADAPVQLGAPILQSMLDRQQHQVAGVQSFISSVKYAYMCHFYANPLSALASSDGLETLSLQAEHLEAVRSSPSFRAAVEKHIEDDSEIEGLRTARAMIEDDEVLQSEILESEQVRRAWTKKLLRTLLLLEASGVQSLTFSKSYVNALDEGISTATHTHFREDVLRLKAEDILSTIPRIVAALTEAYTELSLDATTQYKELVKDLKKLQTRLSKLKSRADADGLSLRSKYSGQSKVMRTTVIAQKVQLSRDSAALRDEDKEMTEIVETLADLLVQQMDVPAAQSLFLSEAWLYDSKSPSRDVFVPRPRIVFQRSLSRPHDYLACACCSPEDGGTKASYPATCILYQLYTETGNLINVADLWSAFFAQVSDEETDERSALVSFYQALAELRAMGYVKSSRKKTDHVAKVKWL